MNKPEHKYIPLLLSPDTFTDMAQKIFVDPSPLTDWNLESQCALYHLPIYLPKNIIDNLQLTIQHPDNSVAAFNHVIGAIARLVFMHGLGKVMMDAMDAGQLLKKETERLKNWDSLQTNSWGHPLIDHRPYCRLCKTRGKYNLEYDTYFCPSCLVWLEPRCSDETCEFCTKRPAKPLKEKEEKEEKEEGGHGG